MSNCDIHITRFLVEFHFLQSTDLSSVFHCTHNIAQTVHIHVAYDLSWSQMLEDRYSVLDFLPIGFSSQCAVGNTIICCSRNTKLKDCVHKCTVKTWAMSIKCTGLLVLELCVLRTAYDHITYCKLWRKTDGKKNQSRVAILKHLTARKVISDRNDIWSLIVLPIFYDCWYSSRKLNWSSISDCC